MGMEVNVVKRRRIHNKRHKKNTQEGKLESYLLLVLLQVMFHKYSSLLLILNFIWFVSVSVRRRQSFYAELNEGLTRELAELNVGNLFHQSSSFNYFVWIWFMIIILIKKLWILWRIWHWLMSPGWWWWSCILILLSLSFIVYMCNTDEILI
jgi:magnesium-transporting ATPase (P-type)